MQERETSPSVGEAKDLFLKKLRTATGPMHEKLEANSTSAAILKPEVTLQQYAKYLAIMKDIIAFDEEVLFPIVSTVLGDLAERQKLQMIIDDLDYLKQQGASYIMNNQYAPFKAADVSLPFALGYMYVMEGSTLGGRVILKHIAPTLKLDENGTKFFAGYAANTGKLWKSFLDEFVNYVLTNNDEEEAIKGAQHAFQSIDDYYALNA